MPTPRDSECDIPDRYPSKGRRQHEPKVSHVQMDAGRSAYALHVDARTNHLLRMRLPPSLRSRLRRADSILMLAKAVLSLKRFWTCSMTEAQVIQPKMVTPSTRKTGVFKIIQSLARQPAHLFAPPRLQECSGSRALQLWSPWARADAAAPVASPPTREIGKPINSEQCSETAEGAARESEGRSWVSLLCPVRQDQPRGHPGACLCPVPLQQGRTGCGWSGVRGHRGVWGAAVARRTGACDQAGDLPTGSDQTSVYTEGQRQAQAAGHLDLAGSGLHDSSDAGAGTDLRSRPFTRAGLPPSKSV
jgi:hypothetical protein